MLELFNDSQRGVSSLSGTPTRTVVIDLSVATTAREFPISGKCFYVDVNSTGSAVIDVSSLSVGVSDNLAQIVVGAQSYVRVDFTSLKIGWASQPGAKLVLLVGDFFIRSSNRTLSPVSAFGNIIPSGTELSWFGQITNPTVPVLANRFTTGNCPVFPVADPNYDVAEIDELFFTLIYGQPTALASRVSSATFNLINGPIINGVCSAILNAAFAVNLDTIYYMSGKVTFPKPLVITKVASVIPSFGVQIGVVDSGAFSANIFLGFNGRLRKS